MATRFYMTTAAAPDLSTDGDRLLSTTAGASLSAATTNTAAGPATIQISSGVLFSFWFQVAACTISSTITFNLWGSESAMTANAGFRVVVDRCDSTGAFISNVVSSSFGTELGTSAAANNWTAAPASTTFNDGDYLRVRCYITDAGGTMGSGATANFRYNDSVANGGDTWVEFTEAISAGSPPAGDPLPRFSHNINQAVQRSSNW